MRNCTDSNNLIHKLHHYLVALNVDSEHELALQRREQKVGLDNINDAPVYDDIMCNSGGRLAAC